MTTPTLSPVDSETLIWAKELMQSASDLTLHYFRKKLRTIQKPGDEGIVTEADLAVEKHLKDSISQRNPQSLFLAEESATELQNSPHSQEELWIIDPIDGTNNFAAGNPYYCVSVACGRRSPEGRFEPHLGFVAHPTQQELFWAARGHGAFRNSEQLMVAESCELAQSNVATCFGHATTHELSRALLCVQELSGNIRSLRVMGAAALDIAQTAAGTFNGFYEQRLQPWDLAAGTFIAQEAGLRVCNLEGKPFDAVHDRDVIVAHPHIYKELQTRVYRCLRPNAKE